MDILKSFLGRVFALWALLCFTATLLIVIGPFVLLGLWKEPARSHLSHYIFAGWMDVFFVLVGVRRIITGQQHFRRGEKYIIVCNHNSFMDVPLASGSIPGANKTIAKVELARTPVFGLVYKRGSVLVNRKSETSRKESYVKMKDVLQHGIHMCIYPEGTRNKTDQSIQHFYDGAFRLAIDTGTTIIPTVILYTKMVLPQHKPFYFWPHRVEMHFLTPVAPHQQTLQQLKEAVHGQMKMFYEAKLNN